MRGARILLNGNLNPICGFAMAHALPSPPLGCTGLPSGLKVWSALDNDQIHESTCLTGHTSAVHETHIQMCSCPTLPPPLRPPACLRPGAYAIHEAPIHLLTRGCTRRTHAPRRVQYTKRTRKCVIRCVTASSSSAPAAAPHPRAYAIHEATRNLLSRSCTQLTPPSVCSTRKQYVYWCYVLKTGAVHETSTCIGGTSRERYRYTQAHLCAYLHLLTTQPLNNLRTRP